jgi:DNA-binding transcriptional LysR family regulator
MLRRRLPSTNALFTFEAVARLRSFSDAANELNVTQPAVSRSINNLETHLGYDLFERHGRWIELTLSGGKLFRATSTAFNTITNVLRDIEQQDENRDSVRIAMTATAINFWFIPRMAAFNKMFPSINLDFQFNANDMDSSLHNFDLGIILSNPRDSDMHRWPFADEQIVAICTPEYYSEYGCLDIPRQSHTHTLIQSIDQRYTLDEFFHSTGLSRLSEPTFIRFSDYSSVMQATLQGQGISLALVTDTSKQIIEGNLVPACTQVVKTGRRYHVVASNLHPMRPLVEDVRDWLISEMRNDHKKMTAILKDRWALY